MSFDIGSVAQWVTCACSHCMLHSRGMSTAPCSCIPVKAFHCFEVSIVSMPFERGQLTYIHAYSVHRYIHISCGSHIYTLIRHTRVYGKMNIYIDREQLLFITFIVDLFVYIYVCIYIYTYAMKHLTFIYNRFFIHRHTHTYVCIYIYMSRSKIFSQPPLGTPCQFRPVSLVRRVDV